MAIDKTTGKGCAWGIAAKTISKELSRKLIDDGIIGRAFCKDPRRTSYDLFLVVDYEKHGPYVISRRLDELVEDSLWTPTFVDAEKWRKAASRFRPNMSLVRNVEEYLLPEMEEYLQSIPNTELVSMTRDFLIEHRVLNTPISQRAGKTYYFNQNEVYTLDEGSKLFPYERRIKCNMFYVIAEPCFNVTVWRKAASQFKVGMTLKECVGVFLKTELAHRVPQEPSPVERLVQHIAPSIYERVPENRNESTFDRIRVTVGLPRYQFDSWETLRDEVKKYQHEIYQRVIQKVQTDRQFKKYGVPINFLELSEVVLRRDFSIEFILELKKQSEVSEQLPLKAVIDREEAHE